MCNPREMASIVHQLDFVLHVLQIYSVLIGLMCVYLIVLSVRRKH